ncbi:MAG: hypothetical protein ABW185_16020 [Sedimenticola sp.]
MTVAPLSVFGEVLFDVFPGGKRMLGSAPFNLDFAVYTLTCRVNRATL